jgi:hypothetical protein
MGRMGMGDFYQPTFVPSQTAIYGTAHGAVLLIHAKTLFAEVILRFHPHARLRALSE